MITKIKKISLVILVIITCGCLTVAAAISTSAKQILQSSSPQELFDAKDMTLTTNVIGNSLRDADGNTLFGNENKSGVKLSSKKIGAAAKLGKAFSDAFEIDMRVWSDTTITEADGFFSNFEDVDAYDLRELQLIFEDNSGQNFTVHVSGGDIANAIRSTARVSVQGGTDRYSHMYNETTGEMLSYRANSYGTWLFGMGFANRSRAFKTNLTTEKTITTRIGFDPKTMEVYGYGLTTDNVSVKRYTIWRLDNALNASNFSGPAPTEAIRTLSSFGDEYTVSLKFADITEGREAKAVVYSVCGQSLAGDTSFTEDSGPAISLKTPEIAHAMEEFDLTKCVNSINDFFEGNIKTFSGKITVKAPDNSLTELDETTGYLYSPPIQGVYTLTYCAKDSKGNYGESASINWNVSHEELTEGTAIGSLFNMSSTSSITTNANSPSYADKYRGFVFTADTAGSSVEYKNKIKLQKNTPFIKFMALPEAYGKLDFNRVVITLADAHNTNNVLRIAVHSGSWGNEYSYIRAGANNMRMGGYNLDSKGMEYNETNGFVALHSFTGESKGGNAKVMSLSFDSKSLALKVSPTPHTDNTIIDFDDAKYLSGQAPWDGFTNDEVYLSVSLTMFAASRPAKIFVSEINGQPFDGNYLYDIKAPEISLDLQAYTMDTLPLAAVGKGYSVFKAIAFDEADGDLSGSVMCRAYYNYGETAQREITVENGKFNPDAAGVVSLVYSAQDAFGNTAHSAVRVIVLTELDEIEIKFNDSLTDSLYLGVQYFMPTYRVLGGSGKKTVEFLLVKNGEEWSFDGKELYFTEVGEYVIKINITDYLGTVKTFEHAISAGISERPIITVGEFPPAYIQGCAYDLPNAIAKDWHSENGIPKDVDVKITAAYAGEEPKEIKGQFTPHKKGIVTITYTAANIKDSALVASIDYEIVVLDGVGIQGLFNAVNGKLSITSEGAILSASSQAKFVFVNPIFADTFSLRLQIYSASGMKYNSFMYFGIKLYECGNSVNSIQLRLTPDMLESNYSLDSKPFAALWGKMVYVEFELYGLADTSAVIIRNLCNQPINASPHDIIKPVIYIKEAIIPEVGYGKIFTVPKAVVYDIYDPNAVVYVTIYAPDGRLICQNARISEDIKLLADQYGYYNVEYIAYDHNGNKLSLSYSIVVKDGIDPVIVIDGEVPKTAKMGNEVKLPSGTVFDNLAEDIKLYIFVLAPDGKMFAAEGSFVPNLNGEYKVYYFAMDDASNYTKQVFNITVAK